jgi:hypothetical protein
MDLRRHGMADGTQSQIEFRAPSPDNLPAPDHAPFPGPAITGPR